MKVFAALSLSALAAFAAFAQEGAAPKMDAEGYGSVDEIPETEITSLPFVISRSGYYFLKTNLTLTTPDVNGIVVNADKVGIDGLGFSVVGPGEGSGHGIAQNPTNRYVMIANATLIGWLGAGRYAVHAAGGGNRIENVVAIGNSKGIYCGDSSTIASCVVRSNAVQESGCGIYAKTGSEVAGCAVAGVAGQWDGCGIRVESNSAVRRCSVENITSDGSCYGILAGAVCRIEKCEVRFCRGQMEPSAGIRALGTSVFLENSSSENSHHGIWMAGISRAERNVLERNGAIGLYVDGPANRIEKNLVVSNKWGIRLRGAGNCIIGNQAAGNEVSYDGLSISGNVWGVISKTAVDDPKANLDL